MKKLLFILVFFSGIASAQVRPLKLVADTILMYSDGTHGTALQIKNASKDTLGFLINLGNGVTAFKRAVQRIGPNQILIGYDTVIIGAIGPGGLDSLKQFDYVVCFYKGGIETCVPFGKYVDSIPLNSDSTYLLHFNNGVKLSDSTFLPHTYLSVTSPLTYTHGPGPYDVTLGLDSTFSGGGGGSDTSFTPNLLIYTNTLTPTGALADAASFLAAIGGGNPISNNENAVINGYRVISGSGTGETGLIEISISHFVLIPEGLFRNNSEITGFVDLGGLLAAGSEIQQAAFKNSTLKFFLSANFGYSSNMGDSAFYGCSSLNSVRLPLWAASDNPTVFKNSSSIFDLVVLSSGTSVTSIETANGFTAKVLANVPGDGITASDTTFLHAQVIANTAAILTKGTVNSFGKVDGYGITSSVANSTTTPVHTIAVDTSASGLSGKYVRISDSALMLLNYRNQIITNTADILTKQATLISGTNIKTINSNSLLGSGNLVIAGADSVRQTIATDSIKQYSSGVGTLAYRTQRVFNVKDNYGGFGGAKGDGVTNDTRAIQAAINACSAGRGGTVFFPDGVYIISDTIVTSSKSQIIIPTFTTTDTGRTHITLLGESKPNMIPTGGGLAAGAGNSLSTSGVILKSTLTTFTTSGQAVIGSSFPGGAFNQNYLSVENIAIQVKNNPSGTGPVVGGISGKNLGSVACRYVTVYVDTSGYRSTLPVNDVTGIETPDNQAENFNSLENTVCVGFKNGYKLGEHCSFNQTVAWCNYYGYNFKTGGNTSIGLRTESQWNAYDIYASGAATLGNWNLTTEWQQIGRWYDWVAMIKDSANLLTGQVYYTYNFANGIPLTIVLKSGAANIHVASHTEGVATYASGMAIGNTVTSATAGSVLFATTSSVLAQDNSNFFWDNTNKRLGIGTTAPGDLMEVKSSGTPAIVINASASNGSALLKYQKNGTNKWAFFMDNNSNGTADWSLYDYANSKPRVYLGIAGTLGIGGNATTQATAAMWVDNSNNVFMDNTNFKMNTTTHGLELPTLLTVPQINVPSTSLTLNPSGKVLFGTSGAYDIANNALGVGTTSPTSAAGFGYLTLNGSSGGILDWNVGGTLTGKMFSSTNQIALRTATSAKYVIQVNGNTSTNALEISTAGITNLFKGTNVTSAGTITATGNLFHVTGTTTITSVSGTGIIAGTTITIIFDGALTFTDGSNLKLAGNFTTSADATITLTYDGTNWYEKARSVN